MGYQLTEKKQQSWKSKSYCLRHKACVSMQLHLIQGEEISIHFLPRDQELLRHTGRRGGFHYNKKMIVPRFSALAFQVLRKWLWSKTYTFLLPYLGEPCALVQATILPCLPKAKLLSLGIG